MSRKKKPAGLKEGARMKTPSSTDLKKIKRSHWVLPVTWWLVLIALLIPAIYGLAFKKSSNSHSSSPEITLNSWFNGSYQERQERYSKKNWSFAVFFSSLNNQIDYSLLNKVNVAGFVKGKNNNLYESDYIKAYLSEDYIGEDSIRRVLTKLKVVADSLKIKDIDLVIVYAPGKPAIYPEYLPSGYGQPMGSTNLQTFKKLSDEFGLNSIDMQNWFLSLKSSQPYPLFPPFGLHWSYYGECLAEDSIIKYIERLRNRHLPQWKFLDPVLADPYRIRDADVIAQLHLFWIPSAYQLAYPKIGMTRNSQINTCRVLGIGDSYYFGIHYDKIQQYIFDHGEFWRYYNTIVYDTSNDLGNQTKEIWEVDLRTELERNQVVLLMVSDHNLTNFGWGFVQDAYLMYTNPLAYENLRAERNKINPYLKQVRLDKDLMDDLSTESQQKNIPLDTLIMQQAKELQQK